MENRPFSLGDSCHTKLEVEGMKGKMGKGRGYDGEMEKR